MGWERDERVVTDRGLNNYCMKAKTCLLKTKLTKNELNIKNQTKYL